MNKHAREAARLLSYYFRLIAKKSGVNWDSDNDAEVAQIIEEILDAAADHAEEHTAEQIENHNNARISHTH